MTATLQFHLPDDRHEHLAALHGAEAFSALADVDRLCRDHLKYSGKQTADELAETIRNEIRDALTRVEA